MRRALPYIAALVMYVMLPGAGELTEQLLHFAETGHGAHAFDDAEHSADDPEHGCTGPFHICACHSSPSFLTGEMSGTDLERAPLRLSWHAHPGGDPQIGFSRGIYRPPAA